MQKKKIVDLIEKYKGKIDIVHSSDIYFHYNNKKYNIHYYSKDNKYNLSDGTLWGASIIICDSQYKYFFKELEKFLKNSINFK